MSPRGGLHGLSRSTSLFLVLAMLALPGRPARAQDYTYPYHDPYLATATAAILDGEGLAHRPKREVLRVPGLPGRDQARFLERRDDLSVALYRQHHAAPLIFILSGIGTNPYFGLATYLAGLFYRNGYHVVILPSPMTWNFALAASRSGVPGYTPDDARDLYAAMQSVLSLMKTQYDIEPSGINFLGASLGALEGAYLSVLDADERKIGIQRYLLINPPLDLSYAFTKVDEWDGLQDKFGRDKSKRLLAKALGIVESFPKDKRDDPAVIDKFVKAFAAFSTEELQFLIAEDFQSLLPELIYVTEALEDHGALKTPKDDARKRLLEAKGLTFSDYSQKIALPVWRRQLAEPQADIDSFWKRGSLAPILPRLRGYSPVQFMHNADDFIARRESIEDFKAAFGDQVMLYPYGGHLGNLWYPENKQYVLRYFKTPR